uniref:Protein aurora borealis n=1 Tax=Syphacia muris TaxID=451379 RepID=A0A0N5ACA6_9BILA
MKASTSEVVNEQLAHIAHQNSVSSPDIGSALNADVVIHSLPVTDPRVFGFKDLEEKMCMSSEGHDNTDLREDTIVTVEQSHHVQQNNCDALSMHLSAPQLYPDSARSNTFPVASSSRPGGYLRSSAFKPYSETSGKMRTPSRQIASIPSRENIGQLDDDSFELVASTSKWNPFIEAPFNNVFISVNEKLTEEESDDTDKALSYIIESDPFGAAPFDASLKQTDASGIESRQRKQINYSSGKFPLFLMSDVEGTVCTDETDVFKVNLANVPMQTASYKHLKTSDCNSYIGYNEEQRNEQLPKRRKDCYRIDWSSEDSSFESPVADDPEKLNIPSDNDPLRKTEVAVKDSDALPTISESSGVAPLLSSLSLPFNSKTTSVKFL